MTLNLLSAYKTLESRLCDSQCSHTWLTPAGSIFIWSLGLYEISRLKQQVLRPKKSSSQDILSELRWWPLNHDRTWLSLAGNPGQVDQLTHKHKQAHTYTCFSPEGNPRQREQMFYRPNKKKEKTCLVSVKKFHFKLSSCWWSERVVSRLQDIPL